MPTLLYTPEQNQNNNSLVVSNQASLGGTHQRKLFKVKRSREEKKERKIKHCHSQPASRVLNELLAQEYVGFAKAPLTTEASSFCLGMCHLLSRNILGEIFQYLSSSPHTGKQAQKPNTQKQILQHCQGGSAFDKL